MPNPLVIPAAISAGTGLIGSIAGSPHKQYKYQKRLMDRQNQYNVENATIAYNRSRQLTQDAALLEKLGKQQAGINTAFGENGNVANASSAPQSNGVSIPPPPDLMGPINSLQNGLSNAVNQLIGLSTAKANVAKLNAETEGIETDNLTRNIKNLKEIGLKDSEIRKNFADAAYQKVVNKYADSRLYAESEEANSRATISSMDASVRGAMNDIDYLNKVQDIQNKVATRQLTQREAAVELKKLSVMDSEIEKNHAAANLSFANTEGVQIDNEIKRDTKEEAKDMLRSNSMKAWLDSLPRDMQQVVYSSKAVHTAVRKLQMGQDLSADDFTALGAAMGYENAGKLVGSILKAISVKKGSGNSVSVYGRANVHKK